MARSTRSSSVSWEVRPRSPWIPIGTAVVGLVLLAVVFEVPHRHAVEDKLADLTKVALADAGIDADVHFTGRDATVKVETAEQVEQAKQITLGIDGVRVVTVEAPPKVPEPPKPAQPVTVKVLVDSGKVTLTGAVTTEAAHKALVAAATDAVGAANVQDAMTIDATLNDGGVELSGLGAVIVALGKDTKAGVVDLTSGTVTLTGTVASQDVKDKAEVAAKAVVPSVKNDLAIGEAAPAVVQTQLGALPTVEFENDSATLTAKGRAVVENVASILRANPNVRISIEGHTDSTGTAERNLTLSQARAKTVLDTLVTLSIDPARMTSTGFGESRPKVPGNDDAAKAVNRRVEFIVQ